MTIVPVTSADLDAAEVSWFSALCSDDYEFLGVPDGKLRSSWEHCSDILKEAEAQGFRNILCPSSYQVGQDTLSFVAGGAPITKDINFLAAIRCGEMQPIMLARTVATLDHMLRGRLTLNVISSDFPGQREDSAYRYQRSHEVVEILKQAWTQDEITYHGEIYQFDKVPTGPAKPYQTGGPLLYFGGYSPPALELCGKHCDVYLMWPEPKDQLAERMKAVNAVAEQHNRTLDYGLRVHVIVRDTEQEAREYADHLVSKLDDEYGKLIRDRAHDSISLGLPTRPKRGNSPTSSAMLSRISGPAWAARVPAVAPRWSAPPIRCSPSLRATRRWACAPSSCPAIRTLMSARALVSAFCRR